MAVVKSPMMNTMVSVMRKVQGISTRDFYEIEKLQYSSKEKIENFAQASYGKIEYAINDEIQRYEFGTEYSWVVYPIDNFTSFSRGMPHFGSALVCLKYGRVFASVILLPVIKEICWLEKDKGTYLEDSLGVIYRLKVGDFRNVDRALVGVDKAMDCNQLDFRCFGSGFVNFVYLCTGRLDALVLQCETEKEKAIAEIGSIVVSECKGKAVIEDGLCIASNHYIFDKIQGLYR